MSGRRGLTAGAFIVAGGVGYYLYNAGGDPVVAEKAMKADAHKASAKIKSEIPGRVDQAEAKGDELTSRASSEMKDLSNRASNEYNKASAETKSKLAEAQAKAQEYKEKTGKELNKAVDNFDKTVEKKAAEAKSGLSSWFGGK